MSKLMRLLDFLQLLVAFAIMSLESLVRSIVTLAAKVLPDRILAKHRERSVDPLFDADAAELIKYKGYPVEVHYVTTADGYILGMQRIPRGRNVNLRSDDTKSNAQRPVVFVLHGFMQCSEAWVCRQNAEDSLPLRLADMGYDVWLGNVRGNKYSFKHVRLTPDSPKFWDFCLDDMIRHDIPTMLEYVLKETRAETLSYVGFSQGTALGFGVFSAYPELASRVNVFIALASTAFVRGLANPIAHGVASSRPELLFLMFGRRSFLRSALFWRAMLGPQNVLVRVIDVANRWLFGWRAKNIAAEEKPLLYAHLYSYSSVKQVVHWFQIMRMRRFQMFDDTLECKRHGYKGYSVPEYQLHRIACPIALFVGANDPLPDVDTLVSSLPVGTVVHKLPKYEHLDFMWAADVATVLYPEIFALLRKYAPLSSKRRSMENGYVDHLASARGVAVEG